MKQRVFFFKRSGVWGCCLFGEERGRRKVKCRLKMRWKENVSCNAVCFERDEKSDNNIIDFMVSDLLMVNHQHYFDSFSLQVSRLKHRKHYSLGH